MNLRTLLLAGTVLPLALNYPALAVDRAQIPPGGWVLAQAEEPVPCPEGQECPPPEEPAAEEPAPEQPAPEAPAVELPPPEAPVVEPPPPEVPAVEPPPPEAPVVEPPPPEAPAAEPPPPEAPVVEPPPPEAPAAEPPPPEAPAVEPPPPEAPAAEPPPPEAPAAEPPPPEAPAVEPPPPEAPAVEPPPPEQPAVETPAPEATEAPTEENAVERARRRQQELQQGEQPAAEQPAAEPPAQEAETPPPPPLEEQSTVEQQLEAQGDQEQAEQVRTLRDRLQEQMQEVLGAPEQESDNDTARPRDRNRQDGDGNRRDGDRDRRDGDRDRRDRDWGWDRHEDEDVVEERGGRLIIDLGGGNIYIEQIVPDDGGRLLYGADDVEVQNLPGGRTRTIVYRDNGVQIVTVRDRYGDIIKRSKILPNGREIVLIDNRFPEDYAGGPPVILYDLPQLDVRIPQREYIVDYGDASDDEIRGALLAPPVQELERPYTLDEVLRNEQVRAYSPRIDLDSITFEFGSSTIGNDQMGALSELGQAMEDVLAEHPDEVYLIEGHTDLVGSDNDNLILSDERAEAVATALSQNFDIPPENLVTEGYGEAYPKVDTEAAERRNRRATVRRLTELLQAENQ